MPLEKFSLDSLSRTRVGAEYEDALRVVEDSFINDADVEGERSITLKVTFKKNSAGSKYKTAVMSVDAKTPRRGVSSIATLDEQGNIMIDTLTDDARQPSLFEKNDKVVDLKKANGGQ